MRDSEFIRSKVPMTKEEVRAISLDKLNLHMAKKVLDIGAGTGSVTIQAARNFPDIKVVAIEHNEEAVALIQKNIDYFNCENISLIQGKAPIQLDEKFDAIFVGGTGGNMVEIFDWCNQLLLPGGRLVLNFILIENVMEAIKIAEDMEWEEVEVISLQASRWTSLGKGHYFKPQNPTFILSAVK